MFDPFSLRYELLIQWRDIGERDVSVEWLRETFQVGDKYPSINDLKKRVIETAVAQINEHSDLWVKWEQRKTGRIVTHLLFKFGLKVEAAPIPSRLATSGEMISGVSKAEIEAKALPGETYAQAAERLKRPAQKK